MAKIYTMMIRKQKEIILKVSKSIMNQDTKYVIMSSILLFKKIKKYKHFGFLWMRFLKKFKTSLQK